MKIPLIKPFITPEIKERVLAVLDSGYLTEGSITHDFEKVFAQYVSASYSIAVTSCTTGLEIALRAIGIGPGDEVIVPDYTYPATASVVSIVGAHCVIVDVDPSNMLIDYDAIEEAITPKTKAIIPVSLFGNLLDYTRLNEIKKKNNIYIIEDAACSVGSEFNNKKVGTFADISVFSLHPRKFITTGEGGMITTENQKWAEWMNSYKHFGMCANNASREGVQFDLAGTNYKLSNILSAIGLGQMECIEALINRRRVLAANYDNLLKQISGVSIPGIIQGGLHSYQSYCIFTPSRDKILSTMRSEGTEVQIGTYALHLHKAFQNKEKFTIKGEMPGSITVFLNCLTLPLFHELSLDEQEYIVNRIKQLI